MKWVVKDKLTKEYWVPWFAWYPVSVEFASMECGFVWLETVERKEIYGYGGKQYRYRELI